MTRVHALAATLACIAAGTSLHAQISLQTAVNLALKNSPKVRAAQADLDKARAVHAEAKDAYIPMVSTTAGYGQSTGAPLSVPVIYSISAQSLVFSFSQRDYIRAAQSAVDSTEHQLHSIEIEITEDTTNTYIALDNALQRRSVLHAERDLADKLVTITADRITAGVDAHVELPKSRKTAAQIRLQNLQVDDEIAANTQHLATLTGLPSSGIVTEHASIPDMALPLAPSASSSDEVADSEGIKAAFSVAKSKQYTAFGDSRYLLRPQISLGGNYSRVDAGLSSYASYYPRFAGTAENPNSQNALSFGLQITVPILDMAHRSRARQSAADARRAMADAEQQRGVFREGRAKLQNSVSELALRSEMARDDQEIAQDQLDALRIQLQANAANVGATPANPKDELNAELQERQKALDVLTAELQLRQTQVNLMRQSEALGTWILGSTGAGSRTLAPALPPVTGPSTPSTSGMPPSGTVNPAPLPAR